MMDSREAQLLKQVKLWEETYNDAIDRMVDECYAPDCEVMGMGRGIVCNGREELRALEYQILEANPSRRMTVTRAIASGNTVAVECVAEGIRGARTFGAVFLTFNDEGLIASDHTYGVSESPAPPP